MKWLSTFAIAVALLAWSSVSNANIIDLCGAPDADGALVCAKLPDATWGGQEGTVDMAGAVKSGPAHMIGTIDTNDTTDPTITYGNAVDNETGFNWVKFYVNYTLDSVTSLTGGSLVLVPPPVTNPSGWTGAVTQQLAYVGNVTIGVTVYKEYKGTITYTAGTPVVPSPNPPNDELDFTYQLQNLKGGTHYIYTQEMMPIGVPEPGTLLLVLSGLLGLVALRRTWA